MAEFLRVTKSVDFVHGSLRHAIDKANYSTSPTIVEIMPGVRGDITLTGGEIKITSNIRILNSTGRTLTISGNSTERIFHILPSSKRVSIESQEGNIILTGGKTKSNGGAILVDSEDHVLILNSVVISDNKANKGGGIYSLGKLILNTSSIKSNKADIQGGGIWAGKGITLNKSNVIRNKTLLPEVSGGGGGIFVDGGDCFLDESSVSHNKVAYNDNGGGSGGGIVVLTGDICIENSSHVDHNESFNSAGIQEGEGNIYLMNKSSASHNRSFNSNRGSAGGGGITITKGNVFVNLSHVSDNQTVGMYSGGIVSLIGDVIIEHSKIKRNSNRGPGGGVALNVGNAIIHSSRITHNTGASLGGGLVTFTPNSYVHITSSIISKNTLTNAETIGQTIKSFVDVITEYLSNSNKQALESSGPGAKSFIKSIPEILKRITPDFDLLDKLKQTHYIGGAGIASLLSADVTLINSKVEANVHKNVSPENSPYTVLGGGLFNYLGKVNVVNSTVKDNVSSLGGGILANSDLHVAGSEISQNHAIQGAGIFTDNNATLISSNITQNTASDNGGGIYNKANLTLISSSVTQNSGNGIFNSGTLMSIDSSVEDNQPKDVVSA